MKNPTGHVVMKGGGLLGGVEVAECLHCGAVLIVQLPARVEDWCYAMRTFERKHRDCLDPKRD